MQVLGAKYTMTDPKDSNNGDLDAKSKNEDAIDENMHLFVYGNLKIIDKETGQIIVNKPF